MTDVNYELMLLLDEHSELSQRDMARELGISVGKVNACLRALLDRGLIEVNTFTNRRNKAAYLYALTPRGAEEKINLGRRSLAAKVQQYEALRREIRLMRRKSAAGRHPVRKETSSG